MALAERARMQGVHAQVPVEFATMTQRVMASVADRRFNVAVLGTLRVVLIGALVGIGGAISATGLIRGLLWGVAPGDPITFAGASLLLVGIAWLATWIPAHRSTSVDPLVTMRAE